jgi:phosphate transport system permease protein
MALDSRRIVDHAFTGLSVLSIVLMAAALLVILLPMFVRGVGAYVFRGTVERREMMLEKFGRGDREKIEAELETAAEARAPLYGMLREHEETLWRRLEEQAAARETEPEIMNRINGRQGSLTEAMYAYEETLRLREFDAQDRLDVLREDVEKHEEVKELVAQLVGPMPWEERPLMAREQYGETRWDRTLVVLHNLLYYEDYEWTDPNEMARKVEKERKQLFTGTALEPMFGYARQNLEAMMRPRWTFYWRFLFDSSTDAHFFGGIWPELLGTIYLTVGAMIFALPMGVIAAIYLTEYAGRGRLISLLRSCISTLAGVPSIVFGLFGLAFFINTLHVSEAKSVLAGSLTLALLVLPTVIRASEEAIRSVPQTYKEAALSMGASKWRTVVTVILPAALPGILTGTIISMGRAAGETAPIIFTAAVSAGSALKPWEVFSRGTPALPWNIYNIATEHEAVDQIRHVQYGMVFTLIAVVLLLNAAALIVRARISKKLRG